MLRKVANIAAVFSAAIFLLQNHLHLCNAQNYDVQSLCDMSDGNARVSIGHASYIQLHFGIDVHSRQLNECEIVLQTTHSGDGLLVSFQHFDFIGSNSATVFANRECSAIMKAWDGEFYYISTCIGPAFPSAPPTVTFSSLGTVRLELLFRNNSKMNDNNASKGTGTTFTVVATASQKASPGERCNNGCCQPPYTFRCPRMELCIDRNLACNNVSNCGPSTGNMNDENGPLCPVIATDFPPPAHTGVIKKPKETMLNPLWVHNSNSFASVDSGSSPNREYFAKIEMVCGFAFTIFFCVTGIAILLCKMHGRPCTKRQATPMDRYQFRSTNNSNPASTNDGDQRDREPEIASTSSNAHLADAPPTYSSLPSISVVGVNETAPAQRSPGVKSSDAPPSYEILYPNKLTNTTVDD